MITTPQTSAAPTYHPALEALEPRLAPAGIVTVSLSAQGHLTLSGDTAENHVAIIGQADGSWSLQDTSGTDTLFRFQGTDSASLDFTSPLRSIKTNLKGGNDLLTIEGITLAGSLTIQDNGGDDTVTLKDNLIHGPVKITTGAGADSIHTTGNIIGGHLSIHAGGGADQIHLSTGTYKSISAHLGGNTADAIDTFWLQSDATITVLSDVTVQASGRGENNLHLGAPQLTLLGDLTLRGSNSSTNTQINPENGHQISISGDFTYQGGNGNDNFGVGASSLHLTNFTVGGITSLRAGGGEDGFYFFGVEKATLSHLDAHTGTGAFTLDIRGQDIQIGSLEIRGGGAYKADVTFASESLWISGDLILKNLATYNKRIGGDESALLFRSDLNQFQIGGDIIVSNPGAPVQFDLYANSGSFGNFTFTGGKYYETIGIRSEEVGQLLVHGDVNLHFGQGRYSGTELEGVSLLGNLNITSQTSVDRLPPGEVLSDYLTMRDVTIRGTTTIHQSNNAEAYVVIHNSSFHGAFNLNTGAGNDNVQLGYGYRSQTDISSHNHFYAPVNIQLGAGKDNLHLDPLDSSGVGLGTSADVNTFHSTLLVNGGPGINTIFYSADDTFATPPTLQNITVLP